MNDCHDDKGQFCSSGGGGRRAFNAENGSKRLGRFARFNATKLRGGSRYGSLKSGSGSGARAGVFVLRRGGVGGKKVGTYRFVDTAKRKGGSKNVPYSITNARTGTSKLYQLNKSRRWASATVKPGTRLTYAAKPLRSKMSARGRSSRVSARSAIRSLGRGRKR